MAKRSASGQTRHDRAVKSIADRLSGTGHAVSADVAGYPTPDAICGSGGSGRCRRPDIVATKGGSTRIIEVETEDSYDKDRGQRRVFREYADTHRNTSFRTVRI